MADNKSPTSKTTEQPGSSARKVFPEWGNELSVVSEEGLSSNFYWTYGREGQQASIQTTVRGNHTTEEIKMHLGSMVRAMQTVVEIGGMLKLVGSNGSSSVAATLPAQAAPEQLPELPGMPTPPEPEAPTDPDVETFRCVQMVVTPMEGGKVKLSFFGNDKKQPVNEYATLNVTTQVEKALDVLAPLGGWTSDHLSKVRRFPDLNWLVDWKFGREGTDSKGKPFRYKDLASIRKG